MPKKPDSTTSQPAEAEAFTLEDFFPYQVRCFYSHVSTTVSQCYTKELGMTRPEWRTMASLGPDHRLTSAQIVAQSRTDKVTVSRAVAKLSKRGWLQTRSHATDGRVKLLELTATGRKVYRSLVPRVLEAEQTLLRGLTTREIREFQTIMARIVDNR
jgi:DNA-binding MarR family transcriptional regulator